jgi:hypothetical protein
MVIDSFLLAECLLMATESWKHNNRLQDQIHLLKNASLRGDWEKALAPTRVCTSESKMSQRQR